MYVYVPVCVCAHAACVSFINLYRNKVGTVDIAVCSAHFVFHFSVDFVYLFPLLLLLLLLLHVMLCVLLQLLL